MKTFQEYTNLTEFLLGPIRERPAMYLGEAKISRLPNFIFGYSVGFDMAKGKDTPMDDYFGEMGFLQWFERKYAIGLTSIWQEPFLKEAENDETTALGLFFKYLEEFNKEMARE